MTGTHFLAATVVAALAFGCIKPGDTEETVRDALEQGNIRQVEVDVEEDGDTTLVHLTGTVDTLAERTRAEEIASAVVGTTGEVRNDLTVIGLDDALEP